MSQRILVGDVRQVLATLPDQSVHCCVTSPPYFGLRDYGAAGQIGLEPTLAEYVETMVAVFGEVWRVLRDDGTLWLNLGDSYAGNKVGNTNGLGGSTLTTGTRPERRAEVESFKGEAVSRGVPDGLKPKDLIGVPWRVAFALQEDGWYLRSDIIWAKCLSGGTTVYARTQKGEMPMTVKDMVRLDPSTVQLWDGEKWNRVVGWRGVPRDGSGLEIELRNGARIGCTPEHRWPTQRGLFKTSELRVGDVLASCRLPEPEQPRNPDLLPDDDIGWFVGLYIAEGSQWDGTIQISSHIDQTERFDRLRRIAERFDGYVSVHQTSPNGATANINSPVLRGVIDTYVSGRTAKDKHLSPRCWKRSDAFLAALLNGYLGGDGHFHDGRWRLGFTANDALAMDLRVVASRIGASVRLRRCVHRNGDNEFPGWRGSLYFDPSRRKQPDTQIVAIRPSRARIFWDIALESEPHLFALGCGVLTHNSNPMPESVTDRPTKSHEYIFLLTKRPRYYFDADAVREPVSPTSHGGNGEAVRTMNGGGNSARAAGVHSPGVSRTLGMTATSAGRNIRSVWTVATQPFPGAHFATFPPALIEPCIKAGTSERGVCPDCGAPWRRVVETNRGTPLREPGTSQTVGWEPTCNCDNDPVPATVLDPFAGAGTTLLVADRLGRNGIGVELNPEYAQMARDRIAADAPMFADVETESVMPLFDEAGVEVA